MWFWRVMSVAYFAAFVFLVAADGELVAIIGAAILTMLSLGIVDILKAIHDQNSHSERTK